MCAAENRGADAHCWACRRVRPAIDWPRRIRRVAAIVFGTLLQIGTGVLIWLYPPGSSAWSWALYLAMGLVGFLHIFIGGELLRRDLRKESQPRAAEPAFSTAALGFADHRCPHCDASVTRAIERGVRRCPSCEQSFSMRELGWPHADPAGEPMSLWPRELRVSGAAIVAALIVLAIGVVIVLASVTGSTPGP